MDLAIDTVDHVVLIKKLDHYRVKGRNLVWFKNYLNDRRQFITHNKFKYAFC